MYDLTSGKLIPQLQTVDNQFIRQAYTLGLSSAKKGRLLTVITKDFLLNRGEIVEKKIKLDSKSVLNMNKLSPLVDNNVSNLQEDLALYRAKTVGLTSITDYYKYIKDNKTSEFLMMDYLLECSLCYVEVFDGTKVNKFFATRNRGIAGAMAGYSYSDTDKYVNYLTPYEGDYRNKQLRLLKISKNKSGYKITQPRAAIDFKNNVVRVVPIFLLAAFLEGITSVLKGNILKFKYIKDNGVERDLDVTLSSKILLDYYDKDTVDKMLNNVEYKLDRGYIRVPSLGISRYDDTGVRALNLARVVSIQPIQEVPKSYIDVDFNTIMPHFKVTLENTNDLNILSIIYQGLLNEVPTHNNVNMIKSEINTYVDTNYAMGTTTFLQRLHDYMTSYKMVFNTYTGKPIEYPKSDDFNLGVEL